MLKDLLAVVESVGSPLCTALKTELASSKLDSKGIPYEVDGFGNTYFMDDANIPSLLSLPLLGVLSNSDSVYFVTRSLVLSSANPYFFSGSAGEGVGGPHVGYNYM